jgi:PAS domain S-box-containing protein
VKINFHLIYLGLIKVLFLSTAFVFSQQLPVHKYTIADGLARDYVFRIRQDSHGFLWFCTAEGLSRFDGYEFHNYTTDDGLPDRRVNDVLETRDGAYWIATNNGLARFNPNGFSTVKSKNLLADTQTSDSAKREPMFAVYKITGDVSTDSVTYLFEDRLGTIWLGTGAGLYRVNSAEGQTSLEFVEVGRGESNIDANAPLPITSIVEDAEGSLWLATKNGLFRKSPGGQIEKFTVANGLASSDIHSLSKTAEGRIWIGTLSGLCELNKDFSVDSNKIARCYTEKEGSTVKPVSAIFTTADNKTYAASPDGVSFGSPDSEGKGDAFRKLGNAQNFNDATTLAEDKDGNLWVGTNHGAFKIIRNGLVTFREPDGLDNLSIGSIIEDLNGEIYAVSSPGFNNLLYKFKGDRFVAVPLKSLSILSKGGWGINYNVFQDRSGEWWFPSSSGAYHFPKIERSEQLSSAEPRQIFTIKDGLTEDGIFHIYEDRSGDVWIGTLGNPPWLNRWERATGKIFQYAEPEEYKQFGGTTAFGEDAQGNIWFGYYNGSVSRYRDGKFSRFTVFDGVPAGQIRAIFNDSKNRLWIGTAGGGISQVTDISSEHPHFDNLSTSAGLSSSSISSITEDIFGRLYLAGARGIDRFEPETGRVSHFTTADGLAGNNVTTAFRDSRNRLWFATQDGISLLATTEKDANPDKNDPPVFIGKLQIGDSFFPVSELGTKEISNLELAPEQNRLQVDFASVSFAPGEILQYQYRLEESKDWSAPTAKRSISFANLAPGNYRFQVRAINGEGIVSREPAQISFKLLPPVWRRWWFITLAAIIIAAAIFALDRFRVKKTRQVKAALDKSLESEERFRTLAQTASDAIITINKESKIVYVNEAIEKVFGYKPEEIIGADLTVLMPAAFRNLHHKGFGHYIETGKKQISWSAVELPGQHKDGREIPLELSFGEFTRLGERYFTGIARDISERRKAEEALQRAREERLGELEKVRKRIATDLHDDIGSSLTQISLLSEVVRQRVGTEEKPVLQPLSMIANASRELVDSMSDIVWAINPLKDHLADLTQRMRRFAADVFTIRNIKFDWNAPEIERDIPVGANVRREIFLIFKESVNNIVKHADCSEVKVSLKLTERNLELTLRDDGRGFDVSLESEGHGLASMKDRVKGLGGTLKIVSEIGQGTTTSLKIPFEEGEENG